MRRSRRGYSLTAWVLWAAVAVLAAGAAVLVVRAARAARERREAGAEHHEKPVPVRVLTVSPRAFVDRISLPGRIEPWAHATVAAEKAGKAVEVLAGKGMDVKAGDLLLQLDSRAWEAQRRQAEVELREAERDEQRVRSLQGVGAVSTSDLDRAVERVDLARAGLQMAATHESQCEVRSPINGRVDDRFVEPGEYVMEGGPTFRIVAVRPLKLAVDVPERDVGAVSAGMPMALTCPGAPGITFTGCVTFVAADGSRDNHTFRVEARVDNASEALRAGMLAQVALDRRVLEGAIVVPLAAVLPRRGEDVVFVVRDGRAERRVVRLDLISGSEVVLAGGVEAGETVVVDGHRDLEDGMPIRVAE